MCGRFQLTYEQYQQIVSIVNDIDEKHRVKTGEIYPTNTIPIINHDGSEKKVVLSKWGYPNFKGSGSIINARSETIEEKPMFRKSFHTKRCLIPANGFYEWTQDPNNKVKYHIGIKDKPLFFMGGIYNTFVDKESKPYIGFVIITIAANELMSTIHSRMPVIVDEEQESSWLKNDSMDNVRSLIRQYD